MNFAANISEALSLYEIVKEDEVAPLSEWQITDVGIKSFSNSERPMEFCMRDLPVRTLTIYMDEGYSIRVETE